MSFPARVPPAPRQKFPCVRDPSSAPDACQIYLVLLYPAAASTILLGHPPLTLFHQSQTSKPPSPRTQSQYLTAPLTKPITTALPQILNRFCGVQCTSARVTMDLPNCLGSPGPMSGPEHRLSSTCRCRHLEYLEYLSGRVLGSVAKKVLFCAARSGSAARAVHKL